MEILTYDLRPCCKIVNSRGKSAERTTYSYLVKLPAVRKFGTYSGSRSLLLSDVNKLFNVVGESRSSDFIARSFNHYVLDGEEDAQSIIPESCESASEVLIPGLHDVSSGNPNAVSSCFWEWKPKLNVHYEVSGCENVKSPAVLFLPGFGVGSFHYEKQLKDLGRDHRVWAIDFLGQGMSLPFEDPTRQCNEETATGEGDMLWGFGDKTEPWADELVYSMDLWREQVHDFVDQVIGEPVYVVGNSLGGYVALYFAARSPELVKGVTLLNATPFWSFLPNPVRSPRLAKLFPCLGTFPLPERVRKLTEIIWQKISEPRSIAEVLKQVYADHSTNIDNVFLSILETTQHPAAAASLASIMLAPQAELSFSEALSRCKESSIPICLMYGKEDPWVTPLWGRQVKRQLPETPYYEISPAGHCPHDEVPEVINYLLSGWIKNLESQGMVALPLLENAEISMHTIAKDLAFLRGESKKSVTVRFVGSSFSLWHRICSYFHSRVAKLETNS